MSNNKRVILAETNGEARSGIERRQFTYTAYIPERRSGKDRREKLEPRTASNSPEYLRAGSKLW